MNLYIVATPIGNLQDITLRAARILLETPIIIAESTSKAGILFGFLKKEFPEIRSSTHKIISFTEGEEEQKIHSVIQALDQNDAVLISEAGTPLISDPGFKLVREAIKRGINVIPVPGPSSPIAALSASGLPTDKFTFLGFLPKSSSKRLKELNEAKKIKSTIIYFESPHRINESLLDLISVFGDPEIVVARELTKIHEEIIRGKASTVLKSFEKKRPKGELTILFYIK